MLLNACGAAIALRSAEAERCKRWEFAALNEAGCAHLNAGSQSCSQDQFHLRTTRPRRKAGSRLPVPPPGDVQKLNVTRRSVAARDTSNGAEDGVRRRLP